VKRIMLKSKIHRATVTEANLEYEGSITIDEDLLRAADILPYEQVDLYDCTNGNRLHTYAIPGEAGSGEICVNGAAAHLADPGDRIIIATFADVPESQLASFHPTVVFVDDHNLAVRTGVELPGPHRRGDGC
jgi:aspartate 1-decarboxylase